jgi:hypothetical protein
MYQDNPWPNLPNVAPYILQADLTSAKSDKGFTTLRLDALPEPFIGRLEPAKVIFLALNPGFIEEDVTLNLTSDAFVSAVRANLSDQYSPFYYFAGELEFTGGYRWWAQKLKPLLSDGVSQNQLAQNIMCIEYFGYHSVNYKQLKHTLPSQQYTFSLVKRAIELKKMIIIMRSEKIWINAVPELQDYQFARLNSPQNVTVSSRNLGEANYAKLIELLKY